jgi:predicted metalloprotease with PDZ domain
LYLKELPLETGSGLRKQYLPSCTGSRGLWEAPIWTIGGDYDVAPSLFMYVAGILNHPVTVTIKPYQGWTTVANGLEPVPGKPYTFSAPDFDFLYDCPTMLGNDEQYQFEVHGVPHYVVIEDIPKSVDRKKIVADLQKIVSTGTDIIGDVPYKHYTFLLMGRGNGGVEHLTRI